jgi:RNA 2',3'-cyclic 3'-phosphodiesterase
MMPNWFLALPVDPSIVAALPRVPAGFRAFHPEDVHLTLTFLGACGEQAAVRAFGSLKRAWSERPPNALEVTLGEVVQMGPKARYSALSALVVRGQEEATSFLAQWRNIAADAAGISRDKRTALPHVTVARPQRKATDAERELGLAWAKNVVLPAQLIRLDRLALYTWSERRLPRLFQIVATTPFVSSE